MLILYSQFIIGIVLFTTALDKLKNYNDHILIIKSYNILPSRLAKPFFILDFIVQILISISFVFSIKVSIFSFAAIFLMALYTMAIIINLLRKNDINCGCGGLVGNHSISWKLVVRNMMLILLLLIISIFSVDIFLNLQTLYILMSSILIVTFSLLYKSYVIVSN
ncbi:hypothetical protein HFP66_30340 [Bacillus sp. A17A.1]